MDEALTFLRDWQELVGALIGAAAAVLLGAVAIFREEIRNAIDRKNASKLFVARIEIFTLRLEEYAGGLAKALDQIEQEADRPGNVESIPTRVPFPPDADKYVGNQVARFRTDLRVALNRFELSNLELERCLERNHVSLILRLHPSGREVAEAEVDGLAFSQNQLLQARISEALDSVETLINYLKQSFRVTADFGGAGEGKNQGWRARASAS